MCGPNDDMTNPALAEVWCSKCDQPSITEEGGTARCEQHRLASWQLEALKNTHLVEPVDVVS